MNLPSLLKDKSIKLTPQRLAILKEIEQKGHISVEDIFENLKEVFYSLSLSTVYKNVNYLKSCGILCEIKLQDLKSKYEIKKQEHAHFICESCGAVEDLRIDKNDFKKYANYRTIDLYLYGICKSCSSIN